MTLWTSIKNFFLRGADKPASREPDAWMSAWEPEAHVPSASWDFREPAHPVANFRLTKEQLSARNRKTAATKRALREGGTEDCGVGA